MKIMLIEDDPIFQKLIMGVLTHKGHEIRPLSFMDDYTPHAIESFRPDLILMDIILPRNQHNRLQNPLGGIELGLQELHMKKRNEWMDIPILFITIYSKDQSTNVSNVPNTIAPHCLTKPIDFDELASIIVSLERRSSDV